ncbi:exported hypothetical protein [Burkholderia cenocepacia]|nr:exported hypothetical protein [Burkholderia cenocepacia]
MMFWILTSLAFTVASNATSLAENLPIQSASNSSPTGSFIEIPVSFTRTLATENRFSPSFGRIASTWHLGILFAVTIIAPVQNLSAKQPKAPPAYLGKPNTYVTLADSDTPSSL